MNEDVVMVGDSFNVARLRVENRGSLRADSLKSSTMKGFRPDEPFSPDCPFGEEKASQMWNRRKEEEPAARSMSPVPAPSDLSREGIPMSTLSNRESLHTDTHRVASSAVIGKSVVIKGQIYSREDLVIDGEVEGSVEANENKIVVGPNGRVNAGVKAREVVVHGAIKGNVEAGEKIDIRREAKLVGDIKTQRIVIEDGAYFKGSVDIQRPDAAKASAAAAAGQQQPQRVPVGGSIPVAPQQQSLTPDAKK